VGEKVLSISANVHNVSELQPSHVYACLQQHISKLQVNRHTNSAIMSMKMYFLIGNKTVEDRQCLGYTVFMFGDDSYALTQISTE